MSLRDRVLRARQLVINRRHRHASRSLIASAVRHYEELRAALKRSRQKPPSQHVHPVRKGDPLTYKRIDQGQDFTTRSRALLRAVGDGVVHVHSNPGGFGIKYCSLALDKPLSGMSEVYYGHCECRVQDGKRVKTGDFITKTGDGTGPYVGNATGLPGWCEFGQWPPGNMSAGNRMAPVIKGLPRV